jgi:hypothetical protein
MLERKSKGFLYICSMAKAKRPTDTNKLAKSIVEIATGEAQDTELTADGKNAAAVALGHKGGKKGGPARAAALSAKRRKEIAQKAAAARWGNKS